jgi:hypothetical protein
MHLAHQPIQGPASASAVVNAEMQVAAPRPHFAACVQARTRRKTAAQALIFFMFPAAWL